MSQIVRKSIQPQLPLFCVMTAGSEEMNVLGVDQEVGFDGLVACTPCGFDISDSERSSGRRES